MAIRNELTEAQITELMQAIPRAEEVDRLRAEIERLRAALRRIGMPLNKVAFCRDGHEIAVLLARNALEGKP